MMNCTLRRKGMSEFRPAVCGFNQDPGISRRLAVQPGTRNSEPFVVARREFLNANFSEQREFPRT
jgi:hypothetical protein